jgi:hypothetical protein
VRTYRCVVSFSALQRISFLKLYTLLLHFEIRLNCIFCLWHLHWFLFIKLHGMIFISTSKPYRLFSIIEFLKGICVSDHWNSVKVIYWRPMVATWLRKTGSLCVSWNCPLLCPIPVAKGGYITFSGPRHAAGSTDLLFCYLAKMNW